MDGKESLRIQTECIEKAQMSHQLILGMDDVAIRKGHTYNTGLHDLRGESFLDFIAGRITFSLSDPS
ncbi:transposase [Bacillus sp. 03113]|uniref:transposase n=1 Tax=Bacillus sp. 03113 TaxID=2578211 RepID=UPI001144AC35|nr:transposase [Bacillus sp. 03113]